MPKSTNCVRALGLHEDYVDSTPQTRLAAIKHALTAVWGSGRHDSMRALDAALLDMVEVATSPCDYSASVQAARNTFAAVGRGGQVAPEAFLAAYQTAAGFVAQPTAACWQEGEQGAVGGAEANDVPAVRAGDAVRNACRALCNAVEEWRAWRGVTQYGNDRFARDEGTGERIAGGAASQAFSGPPPTSTAVSVPVRPWGRTCLAQSL